MSAPIQFGISLPIHRQFADPRLLVDLAVETEAAGWDGFFVWDHIAWKTSRTHVPVTDPWMVLAAVAAQTDRVKLGPMITPLTRRRPWKVARESVALDHLSGGRLILGVGLGAMAKNEFSAFGEESDARRRGRMLDEALDVITGLWSGEPLTFDGEFYQVKEAHFLPRPVQSPRIPIWVAGGWRKRFKGKPHRRAARYDGSFPSIHHIEETPALFSEIRAYIARHRTNDEPFDMVHGRPFSEAGIGNPENVRPFADAGVTWWMVSGFPGKLTIDGVRNLIRSGPPRE